jgi:hypothetical protein
MTAATARKEEAMTDFQFIAICVIMNYKIALKSSCSAANPEI